jgi:hypothetical protein
MLLLLLSLALLWKGSFIQFDDTSGFGSNDWVMPLAPVSLLLAATSVLVALRDVPARRLLGAALLVLDGLIVVQAVTNPGFRFIWSGEEGELFQFEVALGIGGLALLTRRVYRPAETPGPAQPRLTQESESRAMELTGWARFVAYLAATAVLVFVAFFLGVVQFEATECSGPDFGGECDLAVLGGLAWAAAAIVLATVAIICIEARLYTRGRGRTRA